MNTSNILRASKIGLLMATFVLSLSVQAEVVIQRSELKDSTIKMKVTGEEAKALAQLTRDYNGSEDMYLAKGAGKEDFSSIRNLRCSGDICTIEFDGDVYMASDAEDYYTDEFNAKLKSLGADEVLVSPRMADLNGAPHFYEARLLRLMIENRSEMKSIQYKKFSPLSLTKKDVVASSLYEASLKLKDLSIICHSQIVTGMGVVNFLNESCSLNVKARVQ